MLVSNDLKQYIAAYICIYVYICIYINCPKHIQNKIIIIFSLKGNLVYRNWIVTFSSGYLDFLSKTRFTVFVRFLHYVVYLCFGWVLAQGSEYGTKFFHRYGSVPVFVEHLKTFYKLYTKREREIYTYSYKCMAENPSF